jgi:hypothetical protein
MEIICKQTPDNLSIEETKTVLKDEKIVICSVCYQKITDPSKQIIVHQSFRHIFANPHGYVFEIGCFSDAIGCHPASISSNEFSWFIGYSWQIGICNQCSAHLGWFFSSELNNFWGLILEKLIFL